MGHPPYQPVAGCLFKRLYQYHSLRCFVLQVYISRWFESLCSPPHPITRPRPAGIRIAPASDLVHSWALPFQKRCRFLSSKPLHMLHPCRISRPLDAFLFGCPVQFRVDVETLLTRALCLLNYERGGFGICVLANTCHLPRDLCARSSSCDVEVIAGDLFGNVKARTGAADGCELIPEITIERLKPIRKIDLCLSASIENDHSVVDVFHLRRFDRSMQQVLVSWVERVVDFEILGASEDSPGDVDVSVEITGKGTELARRNSRCRCLDSVSIPILPLSSDKNSADPPHWRGYLRPQ
jgi:hypothetical protein